MRTRTRIRTGTRIQIQIRNQNQIQMLPLQLLMMCGWHKPKWRTQIHAHSCYKSCGSSIFSLSLPFIPLFPNSSFLLQHLSDYSFPPFSCSYVNYCLSPCCSLFHCHFSLYFSFFQSTHTHTLWKIHTHCILLHIPPFACLLLLLKDMEQTFRHIKVAKFWFCFAYSLLDSIALSLFSISSENLIVLHTFWG